MTTRSAPSALAAPATSSAVHALLREIVDYAGLFPPAALAMASAAAEYTAQRESPDAWMLGRFVVPAARLGELETALGGRFPRASGAAPWRLAALLGPALDADVARVRDFNARHHAAGHTARPTTRHTARPTEGSPMDDATGRVTNHPTGDADAVVDVIELRATSPQEVERAAALAPLGTTVYIELPIASDPLPLVQTVREAGVRAKVRTGGVTPELIPGVAELARFIARCAAARVPFKATAGLHHPVRAEHALDAGPASARGTMHGFLNVFLAAAVAAREPDDLAGIEAVLAEQDPHAFSVGDGAVSWRGVRVTAAELAALRERGAISFGSCSFREPVDDLRALGALS